MSIGQLMYPQCRCVWLLAMMVCGGFSVACATNHIDYKVKEETADAAYIHSATEIKNVDSVAEIKITDSSEHIQDFERSLQEFDEKLLRELEQAQQERQESARQKAAVRSDAELEAESESEGDSGATASGEGTESNETASSHGQDGSEEEKTEQAAGASNTAQEKASDRQGEKSSSTQVSTVPSGDDDDIVARQLREAAEAETDPVIKEKLWEEYWKYKNQQNPAAASSAP